MNVTPAGLQNFNNISFGASIGYTNKNYSLKEQVEDIKLCADTALKCDEFMHSGKINDAIKDNIPYQDTFTITPVETTYGGSVVSIKYDSYDKNGFDRTCAKYNDSGFKRELKIDPYYYKDDESLKNTIQKWVEDIVDFWDTGTGADRLQEDWEDEAAQRCYERNIAEGNAFKGGFLYLDEFDYPGEKYNKYFHRD